MAQAIHTIDSQGRRVIDVSTLPDHAFDSSAPVWWGNALLMMIESMTVLLLLASYFYLSRNFDTWPPPQPNAPLFGSETHPDLPIPTAELALIVLSCLPMYWIDMAARRNDEKKVKLGLWLMLGVTIVLIVLRFLELNYHHLKFRWDDNAYGSIIWWLLGIHLTYLLAGAAEFFIMVLWIVRRGLDPKHGLDVTLAGGYWYWTAVTWAAIYVTVYVGARVL